MTDLERALLNIIYPNAIDTTVSLSHEQAKCMVEKSYFPSNLIKGYLIKFFEGTGLAWNIKNITQVLQKSCLNINLKIE